jgi:hypothetical protein
MIVDALPTLGRAFVSTVHREPAMKDAVQVQLTKLGDQVRDAAISDASKQTTLWCVSKLPVLYAQFCQNYESRYGDEITRLVQGALDDLAYSNTASKETMKLGSSITERLRLLHEQSGIPVLNIKSSRTTSSRSRVTTR